MGRELVPRVPSPKLFPKGDGYVGVSRDGHVRVGRHPERAASSASCWRRGGAAEVSTFILTCAPSCCSLRELRLAIWRCEVLGRVSPCRVGWRSLAVVALGREMVTLLPLLRIVS